MSTTPIYSSVQIPARCCYSILGCFWGKRQINKFLNDGIHFSTIFFFLLVELHEFIGWNRSFYFVLSAPLLQKKNSISSSTKCENENSSCPFETRCFYLNVSFSTLLFSECRFFLKNFPLLFRLRRRSSRWANMTMMFVNNRKFRVRYFVVREGKLFFVFGSFFFLHFSASSCHFKISIFFCKVESSCNIDATSAAKGSSNSTKTPSLRQSIKTIKSKITQSSSAK